MQRENLRHLAGEDSVIADSVAGLGRPTWPRPS
jgi:hypothetical protein